MGQCSRINGRYGDGDQSAVGFSGKSTASSRCGGKIGSFFFFCNGHVGEPKRKVSNKSRICWVHGDLHVADGTSRGSQSGQSSSSGVIRNYFEDGSDGNNWDSKLRSRWSFLITGIDSTRPGSRTAVSLFLPIISHQAFEVRWIPPSVPLVRFGQIRPVLV